MASSQDDLYREAAAAYGGALDRLARAYEAGTDKRRDLMQEIHFALWRSFETFDARCSMRTWIYRVAHNVAASHVARQRRYSPVPLASLEEVQAVADPNPSQLGADREHALNRLLALVHRLKPLDRQVILSYLEGLDATAIGEITGISPGNAATKIHRIKAVLARQFHQGGHHAE
jgi:RNA polymerase sigma-70 factor (ECF subfamily)